MKKFALIGAAGYIAPRHMKAIKDTGNELVAAFDPYDGVGIMDSNFPDADFFTEFERFDRHIEKLRRNGDPIDFVTVCSPNYLHDSHIRFGLRNKCDVICEKPLVLNPWNIDALIEIEKESGKKVFTILQLRLHPAIIALRERVKNGPKDHVYNVDLTYITSRGKWYHHSWKGDHNKSGGIATNIGVHFFDMLIWVFGDVEKSIVIKQTPETVSGVLKLKKAEINWMLSIDFNTLPNEVQLMNKRAFRTLKLDGEEIEFSDGFTELHTNSYEQILKGNGYGMNDCRKAIELVSSIRNSNKLGE